MELNYKNVPPILSHIEFDMDVNPNGTLSLIDLQEAYLGDIGIRKFNNYREMFDALSSYFYDYIVGYLITTLELDEGEYMDDWIGALEQARKQNFQDDWLIPMLELIVEGE